MEEADEEIEMLDEGPGEGQHEAPGQAPRDQEAMSPLQRRLAKRAQQQEEQPEEERYSTIFTIEQGQAWQLTTGSDMETRSEPVGRVDEYSGGDINPDLGCKAHQLKMKYPHPDMMLCDTCYGILGEGICRRHEKCQLARARRRERCMDCGQGPEACHGANSECKEPLEAAVCVAATLYSRIGHKRYVEACPTADMAGVTTRGRRDMWTGLRASTVAEAEEMTDWDLYCVIDMDASTGRSQVRGTGGRWTMSTANVPEFLIKQYTERKERGGNPPVPQPRVVALADIIGGLSDEESSADEDMAPPNVTYSQRGVTLERLASRKEHEAEEQRTNTQQKVRERAQREHEAAERTRLANAVARNVTEAGEGAMAAAMLQMAQTMKMMQDKMLLGKDKPSPGDSDSDEGDSLLDAASYRHGGDIMSQLLEALDRDKEDLDMRPRLYFCLEAQGYHSKFPFQKMQGDPRHMDISCMLDENAATAADKTQEQKQLQAVQGQGDSSLEAGKNGNVRLVTGKKPQLTKPTLQKSISTKDDLFLALYAWAHHYKAAGMGEYETQVMLHTLSLREIWQSKVLGTDAKALIDLDARLREYRCREGRDACWTVSYDTNSADQRILAKIVTDSRARNSIRRDKDQSDAGGKGGKQGKGAGKGERGGKGTTEPAPRPKVTPIEVPPEFFKECQSEAPDVCSMFAWAGKCSRSSGSTCESNKGHTYLHTCKKCRFEKGEHAIKLGVCPK